MPMCVLSHCYRICTPLVATQKFAYNQNLSASPLENIREWKKRTFAMEEDDWCFSEEMGLLEQQERNLKLKREEDMYLERIMVQCTGKRPEKRARRDTENNKTGLLGEKENG